MTTMYQTIDTIYNADTVEWCPVEGFQDLLLCGTYQLEENDSQKWLCEQTQLLLLSIKTDKLFALHMQEVQSSGKQVRVGRLYLYKLRDHSYGLKLEKIWEKDMPGILDIKWCTITAVGRPTFGLVNSVGQLQLYCIEEDSNSVLWVAETQLCDGCLGLSLDWDNVLETKLEPHIAASDSTGSISIHRLASSKLEKTHSWKAHDYEAWITAFNQWDQEIVFTGGDDCMLKCWDLRMDCSKPVITSRRHTMGVCSVQSSPVQEYLIATGSYDEQLIIWDSRHMRQPITEISLGGGIWRIKWEPSTGNHILTATMYNGFHIVHAKEVKDGSLEIVKHFHEHNSIGYGADWCRYHTEDLESNSEEPQSDSSKSRYIVATCSFYDHILKLWDYRPRESDCSAINVK